MWKICPTVTYYSIFYYVCYILLNILNVTALSCSSFRTITKFSCSECAMYFPFASFLPHASACLIYQQVFGQTKFVYICLNIHYCHCVDRKAGVASPCSDTELPIHQLSKQRDNRWPHYFMLIYCLFSFNAKILILCVHNENSSTNNVIFGPLGILYVT